ncbi:MAG: hypothetical protein IJ461_05335 [Clostridia bacterium]|nr:hypothetical protein [Clostridia bacterium]
MNPNTAQQILLALARGVDPLTGQKLPPEHLINEPAISLALNDAVNALSRQAAQEAPAVSINRPGLSPGIRPWTEEENAQLMKFYIYQQNAPYIIAKRLNRLTDDVVAQLEHLHFLPRDAWPAPPPAPARANRPWVKDEEELLLHLHDHDWSIASIAKKLERTERAIEMRLDRLSETDLPENCVGPHRPWMRKDLDLLRNLFNQGFTVETIAEQMRRDPVSVKARLFYMGLRKKEPRLIPSGKD